MIEVGKIVTNKQKIDTNSCFVKSNIGFTIGTMCFIYALV